MSRNIGDTIGFIFAGGKEEGKIVAIEKKGNKILSYSVDDGKYTYNITKEQIV
jgi:hypothetical protein